MKFFKEKFEGFDSESTRRNRGNERPDDEVSRDDEKALPGENDPLNPENITDPKTDPSVPKVHEDELDDDPIGLPTAEDDLKENEAKMTSWRAPDSLPQKPPERGLKTYYHIKKEHLPPPEHEIQAAMPAKYRLPSESAPVAEPRQPLAQAAPKKRPARAMPVSNKKGLTPEEIARRKAAIERANGGAREAA